MAKITYENKVALNVNSDIADVNKCNATDLNEIKNVVNENDDNTTKNSNAIGKLSSLNTTNKSNLVSAINSVVESGSNTNGNYVKYADGTMICTKKIVTQQQINVAFGGLYETSNTVNFGNYAMPFISVPDTILATSLGRSCLLEGIQDYSNTSFGRTWLMRPSADASVNEYTISLLAIGKWK